MSLSGRDYSLRPRRTRSKLVPIALSVTAISSGSLAILLGVLPAEQESLQVAPPRVGDLSPVPAAEALVHRAPTTASDSLTDIAEDSLQTDVAANWLEMTVASGDTLSGLFDRYGLAAADWMALSKTDGIGTALTRIRPGDRIRINRDDAGRVTRLEYPLDTITTISAERGEDGFVANTLTADVEERIAYASGEIQNSLFLTANASGLSDRLTMELANIFGWDIDFVLDIRRGDRFSVVYEQRFLDGEKIDDGHILAAEFINQGRLIRAVRFETPEGDADYYTPEGDSMRKAFIRTPVDFARISSGFSLGRKHPILNTIRAHRGVDYAAPRGTPIKATGDGKVIFAGTKGGYGSTVIVQHGRQYTTLYAHMNAFRRGVRSGTRVRQGQVIGYVGSSGLATGPHLHYEFRLDGVHRNPITVPLPRAHPVPAALKAEFTRSVTPLVAQLDVLAKTQQVAINTTE